MRSTMLFRVLAALWLAAFALGVQAQQSRPPMRILVGFAPGGSSDAIARVLADKLRTVLNQSVVVENKAGGGGRLAFEAAKLAAPDGNTFVIAPDGAVVFQYVLYTPAQLKYDLLNDLVPVAGLISYPMALAVSTKLPVTNLKEFIDWARANPTQANFGNAGLGGVTHFSGLQLSKAAGIQLNVVPYKGNGPLVTDLIGGQIPAGIMVAGDIIQQVRGGNARFIGVFGSKRSPLLPDVPTMMEQGVDVDTGDGWMGLWAPARTPPAELERVESAVRTVLAMPEVRDFLINRQTLQPEFRTGAEVDALQRKGIAYWGPVIKASGFKPDQ